MSLLFTIITPVFNASSYLERAIASLIGQRPQNWEWIIINDASTDASLAIAKGIQQEDKRIKIIDLNQNKGQGHARNLALQQAKGDYVVCLDADDVLWENALDTLVNAIADKPKTEVFVWGFSEFKNNIKRQKMYCPLPPIKDKSESPLSLGMQSRKGFRSVPWCYVVKRSFIEKHCIRFAEGIFFEDVIFTIQLLFFAKRVQIIPAVCYGYRRHSASVTGRPTAQKIRDKFAAFAQVKSFFKQQGVWESYQPLFETRFIVFCLFTSFMDYFRLPQAETNTALDQKMKQWRASKYFTEEYLNQILFTIAQVSPNDEKRVLRFYQTAYVGLKAIKKRYRFQRFMVRQLSRVFQRIN